MQIVSDQFNDLANGYLRPLSWEFRASFEKIFNPDVEFFLLDSSLLDGTDILGASGDNVVTEWDKYFYRSYTDRIKQIEWQREESIPYSVNLAIADITLNNYDNLFTSGPPALLETIADNFNNGITRSKWNIWGGSNVQPDSGAVEISVGPGVGYKGLATEYGYDLTGSYFSSQLVDAGNQALASFEVTPVELINLNDRNDRLKISVQNGTVYAIKIVNSVSTSVASVSYNASVHKFFRIKETAGFIHWQYSTNGTSWTDLFSAATPIDISNIEANIVAGFFSVKVSGSSAIFDNVNSLISGARSSALPPASPIAQYALSRRPIRILSGFGGLVIPQFVGLTDNPPVIDKVALTAKLHAEDFLSYLFNKPLDQVVIYENLRTDQVLENLFELFGVLPGQYNLDVGQNTIPFVYFEADTKLGDAVRDLMQAEMGRLYMDELGIIQFRNRVRQSEEPMVEFNDSNIVDYNLSEKSSIINVVEIKAEVRQVQPTQNIFTLAQVVELPPGNTEVFFNFQDPITTLETITSYTANSLEDGTGTDETGDISITDTDLFATAVKVIFHNSGSAAYLTALEMFGTPAKVIKNIHLREQNDDSVAKFEEQPYTINNNFIQSNYDATSLALALLSYFANYNSVIEMEVKGNPARQIGDTIHVKVDNIDDDFIITKIANDLEESPKFKQIITARVFNISEFFVLDQSMLNGPDVLAV